MTIEKSRKPVTDLAPGLLPYERDPGGAAVVDDAVTARLEKDVVSAIEALAARAGVATADVLLAAWLAVLARHGAARSVRLAVTGRPGGSPAPWDLEMVVEVDPTEPFHALAARASAVGGGHVNGKPARVRWPDFRFAWAPAIMATAESGGARRLSLTCALHDRGVDVTLAYARGRFRPGHARLHLAAWADAVRDAVQDPELPAGALPRARPYGALPAPAMASAPPLSLSLVALGAAASAAVPAGDGIAVPSRGALAARAMAIAVRLLDAGLQPAGLTIVLLSRGIDAIAAPLGVMRAGGVFVPLDADQPTERVRALAHDCGAALALADAATAPMLNGLRLRTVVVEDATEPASGHARAAHPPAQHAYVLFTSGTTGRPKSVAISRDGLARYAANLGRVLGIGSEDRWAHTASLGFSSSIRQIFLPLGHGGTVAMASRELIEQPHRLLEWVAGTGVTVLDLVPSYWRVLLDALEESETVANGFRRSSLRLLLSASEPLPSALAARILAAAPSRARLVNMYGLSETGGIVSTFRVERADGHGRVPAGTPLPGVGAAVLDEHGSPVPPGVVGRLAVCGPGVAQGYLTAAGDGGTYFFTAGGRRWLQTGDLAWQEPDGTLHLGGREDAQVKIRGVRVDPAEIERCLEDHEAVAATAAIAVDSARGREIVALVVPAPGAAPDAAALLALARRRLPPAFVPARIALVGSLPTTTSGKLHRAKLAELAAEPASRAAAVAPRTPTETVLAQIWSAVLQRPGVGPLEDFFELGGHSLLGLELLRRVEQDLDVRLSWRALVDGPTIAEMASRIDEHVHGSGDGC